MSGGELAAYLMLTFTGLSLSAMFSGLETGIYTLNRVRLAVRAGHGEPQALRLRREYADRSRLLITLLLGNNIANYAGSYGVAAILEGQGIAAGAAIVVNAAIVIPLLFVFGETLPKDLFRTHTDQWTYRWSGFLAGCRFVFQWTGLIFLVRSVSMVMGKSFGSGGLAESSARERISHLIKEGVSAGVLTETQTTLADRALTMRDLSVGSEMIPWRRVATMPLAASRAQRNTIISQRNYTRLPVVEANGRVAGIISLLDCVLEPTKPIEELMTKPMMIPTGTRVTQALRLMRANHTPMAIVIERPGAKRPLGIVTLKDLVEPLTGELAAW